MVLIATGTEQQTAKTVCSISTRVICRSSRFVVCFVVRMLRIVRMANKPKTTTGNTAKITGTSKYAYSQQYINDICFPEKTGSVYIYIKRK